MSIRDFAAHIELSASSIADWEAKGEQARLRQTTQRILDAALDHAPEHVRERFKVLLSDTESGLIADAEVEMSSHAADRLAAGSAQRTRALLDMLRAGTGTRLRYAPPPGAVDAAARFLVSRARVYVVTGPPGCGKTQFVHHAAAELHSLADVQLHAIGLQDGGALDLESEILRYASIPPRGDRLLTLERAAEQLLQPCLVVVDGINGQDQLNAVGRQLDVVLRQVLSQRLRFLLVVRTPPEVDLSAYPVLAASIYTPPGAVSGYSYQLRPWTASEAAHAWDKSRGSGDPPLSDLPPPVQQLARLPLYMELVKTAGHSDAGGELDAYGLVDHCVRSILRTSGEDRDKVVTALADLAARELAALIPPTLASPEQRRGPHLNHTWTSALPLLRTAHDGRATFSHDVFREYFLANLVSDLVMQHGRSSATIGALNALAAHATTTATARGVFSFVISRIDRQAPDLLAAMALSPTISVGTTLPMMLDIVGRRLRSEIVRACARRCVQERAVELGRALIASPVSGSALGADYAAWVIELLRTFGAGIWAEVVSCMERTADADQARRLLFVAHLDDADEATFFARHLFVFIGDDHDPTKLLQTLLGHADWRVRAALAEGVGDERGRTSKAAGTILHRLVTDADYKVRAAAGRAIANLDPEVARQPTVSLLADDNWYVRACTLRAISHHHPALLHAAVQTVSGDQSWRTCPGHVSTLAHRLLLLDDPTASGDESPAHQHALFGLLREHRTGASPLPGATLTSLTTHALRCGSWLVRREAAALRRGDSEPEGPPDPPSPAEAFRRLRDGRSIQIALDLHDLDRAVTVARAAASAGADLIEVGDPLIKHAGLEAVAAVKREVPQITIVAEMMSADWGRDQVTLAAEAGADVVLLIGPATAANVKAAVEAGRRLGVPVVLDIPALHASASWVRDMERAGVDGFSITTNIDLGVAGRQPLARAHTVRSWTRLPVAVSGGFGPTDYQVASSSDWDILIVGRGVVEAVQPGAAVRSLMNMAHPREE